VESALGISTIEVLDESKGKSESRVMSPAVADSSSSDPGTFLIKQNKVRQVMTLVEDDFSPTSELPQSIHEGQKNTSEVPPAIVAARQTFGV